MAVRKLKEGEQATRIQGEQGGSVRPVREDEEVHPIEGAGGGQQQDSGGQLVPRTRQAPGQQQNRTPGEDNPIVNEAIDVGLDFSTAMSLGPMGVITELGPGIEETGEAATAFGTGMLGQAVGGIAGTYEGIQSYLSGEDEILAGMVESVQNASQTVTVSPSTEGGQKLIEETSKPFQYLEQGADKAGDVTLDVTGSPEAATAVKTGIEMAPTPFGLRGARARHGQRKEATREVRRKARTAGVRTPEGPIKPSARKQAEQLENKVTRQGGRDPQGRDVPRVAQALGEAKREAKAKKDAMWDRLEESGARLPARDLRELADSIDKVSRKFILEDMPRARKIRDEFNKIKELPPGADVKLNALVKLRQRINRNRPKTENDPSQAAAMDTMKGLLDNHVETMFDTSMVRGSKNDLELWREANESTKEYKRLFDEDRVIRDMARQEATAQQMRNWLFNSSAVGSPKSAANTVRKMKDILGENSPEMSALRHETFIDVVQPLMKDNPNTNQFIRNYDEFIRKNDDLVQELFPGDSINQLKDLRDIVKGIQGRVPKDKTIDIDNAIARYSAGHGMSKAGQMVEIVTKGLRKARRMGGENEMRRFTRNVLGYDAAAPVLTPEPAILGATIETGSELMNNTQNGSRQESDNE